MPEKCVNGFVTRATANRDAGPKTVKCTATAIVAGIAIVEIASKLGQLRFATKLRSLGTVDARANTALITGPPCPLRMRFAALEDETHALFHAR